MASRKAPKQFFDEQGRPLCRRCQKLVPKRFRSYCSVECRTEFEIAYFPSYARRALHKRDKGVCSICHTDTDLIRSIFRKVHRDVKREAIRELLPLMGYKSYALKGGDFWQVHHTLAVIHGGWGSGLDLLATCCTPCHLKETARLVSELAAMRKTTLKVVTNLNADIVAKISA